MTREEELITRWIDGELGTEEKLGLTNCIN